MAAAAHREIRVDRSLCMGSGQCSWYAPNTFDQDDETIAIVIDPRGDPADEIQNAVDSCPTGALSIVSEGEARDDEAGDKGKDG
jgi:ferredoxin